MRKMSMLALCFLLALPALAQAADQIIQVDRPQGIPAFLGYLQDEIIVVFKPAVGPLDAKVAAGDIARVGDSSLDRLADQFGVYRVRQQFPGSELRSAELAGYHKVRFANGTLDEVLAAYGRNPKVESVEPIGIHAMYATPNDTYYSPYQTYHNQANDHDIDSPEAWDIQSGSASVIVADLDSGARYYHPDLGGANATPGNPGASRGNMWINSAELNGSAGVDDDSNGYVDDWIGYDFIDGVGNCWPGEDCNGKDNDPRDFNGHGTHTAGIVAMLTNDGYGMAGTAGGWGNGSQAVTGNGVKLMALRMGYSYNYLGQEYGVVMMDAAAEAFYYAANNGAKIATCSWGSSNSGGIGAAVNYFLSSGGLIFVAAGNDASQTADYLNGRGDIVSVAAVDTNDAAASFTTYGTWVDICAPGVGIYATYHDHTDPNTNYWSSLSGTSMATPMTAAVGALIWSQNPGWTASQVESQLYSSSDNIDAYLSAAYIGKMGAGRINSHNAVNTGPPVAPVADFSGSPTSGDAPLAVGFSDASTGSVNTYSWTFGDGGTSSAQNPSHSYASAGSYTVSLTVTGPGGSDGETKAGYITVTDPPGGAWTIITYDDFESGFGSYTVGGSDCARYTGGTYAHQGGAAADIQDNSGVASSFYHSSGHNVSGFAELEVEFWFVGVSMEPSEDFWLQYFDGSVWRTVATWAQGPDFANNVFYNKVVAIPAGSYAYPANAQLRFLCDASGNSDDVYIDEVEFRGRGTAAPQPPVAAFTGTPVSGNLPLNVAFTDESSNSPTGWTWDFGDTFGSSTQNPSHEYTAAGVYTVTLTASNAEGSDAEVKTNYITVTAPGGGGWTTITYDDFEAGWGSYVDGGGDCSRYTGGTYAHQGSAAADIQDNSGTGSSFAHGAGHDVSGYSDLEVEFWFYSLSMESGENFWVQYFDGSVWQTVANFVSGTDFGNNAFTSKVVAIPAGNYNYPANARLRFMCDASNNSDDIYLDEIEFRGFAPAFAGGGIALLNESEAQIPTSIALRQNYPNPFNPKTRIEFSLPEAASVKLVVIDVLGRRVAELANERYAAGTHEVEWNAQGTASGVYFARLIVGERESKTIRMQLLK